MRFFINDQHYISHCTSKISLACCNLHVNCIKFHCVFCVIERELVLNIWMRYLLRNGSSVLAVDSHAGHYSLVLVTTEYYFYGLLQEQE